MFLSNGVVQSIYIFNITRTVGGSRTYSVFPALLQSYRKARSSHTQDLVFLVPQLVLKAYYITLILRRSRTGTVWFCTSTSNKRAARPKLYTNSLTRDLKLMYSRLTLVRISIKHQAPHFFYIGTGVSLLFRERFLYI